jgi:ribosome-associated heat shock protein Hsp15
MPDAKPEASSIRLDKWLWFTRQLKSRSKASELVEEGKVRVNREKVVKPAHALKIGDTVTAVINGRLKVLQVVQLGERRGPFAEASALYLDLTPREDAAAAQPPAPQPPARERGSGRPTKRERRDTDRLRHRALYDEGGESD